ncbi:MAG: hypothetical protein C0459_07450 [Chitinophaga sp.]|nr:hypothetical protein [Chitinophaga sp.]
MYGFRKPYTALNFSAQSINGFSYKSSLVIAQSIGYLVSKWIGIRVVSTITIQKRAATILLLLVTAWLALLLFAITPSPYNIFFMFVNGLPLGMVWGLVFAYLEGRTFTDIMGAVLATSFIFASGFAKTVARLIESHFFIPTVWMPFAAGAFFIIPAFIAVLLLNQSPLPDSTDEVLKTLRKPMSKTDRKSFIQQYIKILIPLCIAYTLLTVIRDFCEDFSNDLWIETGYNNTAIFTQTATLISIFVLIVIGGFYIIKNNYAAFQLNQRIIAVGFTACVMATALYQLHYVTTYYWFIIATTGMYVSYVSYNCILFERMMAAYKVQGTVGFAMYVADAFGYMGTVIILIVKEAFRLKLSWQTFFEQLFYIGGTAGLLLILVASFQSKFIYQSQNNEQ